MKVWGECQQYHTPRGRGHHTTHALLTTCSGFKPSSNGESTSATLKNAEEMSMKEDNNTSADVEFAPWIWSWKCLSLGFIKGVLIILEHFTLPQWGCEGCISTGIVGKVSDKFVAAWANEDQDSSMLGWWFNTRCSSLVLKYCVSVKPLC